MSMPDVSVKYADDYKEIFWNRVVGGFRDGYFELEMITESSDFEPTMTKAQFEFQKTVLKRTIHAKAMVPLYSFKDMVKFMTQTLEKYEQTFGKIPEAPKPGEKKPEATSSSDPTFIK